tara:strand:- start:102 stop:377 length:276 start_codon:yes stop_codon:yes gene_type:complete
MKSLGQLDLFKIKASERLQELLLIITGLAGLEPTTYGLGNRCSIQLSYNPNAKNFSTKQSFVFSTNFTMDSQSSKKTLSFFNIAGRNFACT